MKSDSVNLILSKKASRMMRLASLLRQGFLLLVTSFSMLAVLFIIYFIARDALPFFKLRGLAELFTTLRWFPAAAEPEFGALAIFFGSGVVTLGAGLLAVPLGVSSAVCLSDVLPFRLRQLVKPVIEILAAIPSVAYGFFALVVFAPLLQRSGGHLLAVALWVIFLPLGLILVVVLTDLLVNRIPERHTLYGRLAGYLVFGSLLFRGLACFSARLNALEISSGTNALNVSIILGIMALPTIVSVTEDALHAAGRELREGSYAIGATRAETIFKVVIPAAASGILAAVILGLMRAVGETMVVWMASGNATQIPSPWYDVLEPVRTLTATIAGDMGEADHVTGSERYHVLFAMALSLLMISFFFNLLSEWVVGKSRKKLGRR